MTIRSLELTDFTVFRHAELDLCPGVNVFIGENATGKTHAMKALYALARGAMNGPNGPDLAGKLRGVFRPDDGELRRLGHRSVGQKVARVRVEDDDSGFVSVEITTKTSKAEATVHGWTGPTKAVFLPSREGLAMFEGFIPAYTNRELAFDETYYDLAVALAASALRGALPDVLRDVGAELEAALGGKVVLQGPRFYLQGKGRSLLEAPLLSEGMRKLASVLRLLQNGELRSTGLLCWDEPEANLNPRLTVVVARILRALAAARVQVVIATHDYLLTETLAFLARDGQEADVRFFAFSRTADGSAVEVASADDLDALPTNPIRAEYLAHYDRMRGLAP